MRAPPRRERPGAEDTRFSANALRADRMTTGERLAEIAEILAAGLSRLKAGQSSAISADFGESFLDCPDQQSGHANVLKDGGRK